MKEARQVFKDLEPDIRKVARALRAPGTEQPLISHGLGGFNFRFKRKVTAVNYRAFTSTQGSTRVGYLRRFLDMLISVWESFAEAIKHDPARLVKLTGTGRVAFEIAEQTIEFYKTLRAMVKGE